MNSASSLPTSLSSLFGARAPFFPLSLSRTTDRHSHSGSDRHSDKQSHEGKSDFHPSRVANLRRSGKEFLQVGKLGYDEGIGGFHRADTPEDLPAPGSFLGGRGHQTSVIHTTL